MVQVKNKADLGGGMGNPFTAAEEGRAGGNGSSASAGCANTSASASLPLPATPRAWILQDSEKCVSSSGLSDNETNHDTVVTLIFVVLLINPKIARQYLRAILETNIHSRQTIKSIITCIYSRLQSETGFTATRDAESTAYWLLEGLGYSRAPLHAWNVAKTLILWQCQACRQALKVDLKTPKLADSIQSLMQFPKRQDNAL